MRLFPAFFLGILALSLGCTGIEQLASTASDDSAASRVERLVLVGDTIVLRDGVWQSSDSGVLLPIGSDMAIATASGEALLARAGRGGRTLSFEVRSRLSVSPSSLSLQVGQSAAVSAATFGTGTATSVSWRSSNTGVVVVAGSTVTAVGAGTASVSAVLDYDTRTRSTIPVTVAEPPPSAGEPDPTLLRVASGELPLADAFRALRVSSMSGNLSYRDPTTGVKVWKMTSENYPVANSSASHWYSQGPASISRAWGSGFTTLALYVVNQRLVDFGQAGGLTNWRDLPAEIDQITFSRNAASPRIAYVSTRDGRIRRFNTESGAFEDRGYFPVNIVSNGGWLQQDRNDRWFVALNKDLSSVTAWNSETNTKLVRVFPGMDEPYLELDGKFVIINVDGGRSAILWELSTDQITTISAPGNSVFGHAGILQGRFVLGDGITGSSKTPIWSFAPGSKTSVNFLTIGGYYPDGHMSGQWLQGSAAQGNLDEQWIVHTTMDWTFVGAGSGAAQAISFLRLNGGLPRLLAHHYSIRPADRNSPSDYYSPGSGDRRTRC